MALVASTPAMAQNDASTTTTTDTTTVPVEDDDDDSGKWGLLGLLDLAGLLGLKHRDNHVHVDHTRTGTRQ